MDPEDLLRDLNDAQRRAVTSEAAPLCIVAGAGTGKTRVLTRRIAYRVAIGSADPRHVLALTFTRKAAGELGARLRALGLRDRISAGTFHATAYGQLRQRWEDKGVSPPELLERKGRVLGRLLPRRGPSRPGGPPAVTVADLAGEIEWAKARIVSPGGYAVAAGLAGRRPPLGLEEMGAKYAQYEADKRRLKLVDFDDLLDLCARAVEDDADFAAAERWRFRHLFVDEFQDVNPLQHRLLEAWRGTSTDLCVVGDPNQAIYAWNGADPELLRTFQKRHGGDVVELDLNYRSSPQILATANAVLDRGGHDGVRLRPTRLDGSIPAVISLPTDRAEARSVARAVLDRHRPETPWAHQAVLVRTNAQGVLFEEAFQAVRIPYRLRGRLPFTEQPEIRDALHQLRRHRAGFREGLAVLEASLLDGQGSADDADLAGPSDAEAARMANLAELLRLAGDYTDSVQTATADGFVQWLAATVRSEEAAAGADAVEIATFHAAKGLEWPIVHIAGLEVGLVPITYARTPEAKAEERRLFYVALTRAEREVRLYWSDERTFGRRASPRSRSPYVGEIEPVLAALASGADPADWRAHLPSVRAALGSRGSGPGAKGPARLDDPADAELFDALKHWRLARSRAAAVPAYVIFSDATLAELATRRPSNRRTLLAVPGIGPTKAGRFGEDVLGLIARHPR